MAALDDAVVDRGRHRVVGSYRSMRSRASATPLGAAMIPIRNRVLTRSLTYGELSPGRWVAHTRRRSAAARRSSVAAVPDSAGAAESPTVDNYPATGAFEREGLLVYPEPPAHRAARCRGCAARARLRLCGVPRSRNNSWNTPTPEPGPESPVRSPDSWDRAAPSGHPSARTRVRRADCRRVGAP